MKKIFHVAFVVFISTLLSGCNIVPKSVQYQREEEDLIGSIDIINPRVEEIQVFLNALGYNTGTIDGRMGQKTREAIREFQESRGLKTTGYINELTLRQIEDMRRADDERELKKDYRVRVRSPYLEENDISKVERVTTRQIQTALKNAGFDPGAIDGKMGPRTRQAIKEFQRAKGLTPDGVVGPKTWAELGRYLKK